MIKRLRVVPQAENDSSKDDTPKKLYNCNCAVHFRCGNENLKFIYLKLTLSVFQVDLVLVLVNQTRCHFQMHLNMERLDRVFPDSSHRIVSDDF